MEISHSPTFSTYKLNWNSNHCQQPKHKVEQCHLSTNTITRHHHQIETSKLSDIGHTDDDTSVAFFVTKDQ